MRYIYLVLGIISTILGAVGVLLPILPTTPFLLLATFCFARSSKKFETWIVESNMYQSYVGQYRKQGGMTLKQKWSILWKTSFFFVVSIWLAPLEVIKIGLGLILCLFAACLWFWMSTI